MASSGTKLRLTWILFITFNALALGFGVVAYKLISNSTDALFQENDKSANQEKANLIARSIRQSILVSDNVGVRSVFQNALDDPSVRLIRFLPADNREGICIARENECYAAESKLTSLTTSDLYFGPTDGQKLGTLAIRFESVKAAQLNQIISRHIGTAVLLILVFVNIFLFVVIRAFRKQVSWGIEAVRSRSTNQPVAVGRSLFVEQEEFASALEVLDGVLGNYRSGIEKATQQQALVAIARQVAHNIRSPLLALEVGLGSIGKDLAEDKRVMLRSATTRIKDIANGLLERSRAQPDLTEFSEFDPAKVEEKAVFLLSSLIDTLVSEKRVQFRSRLGVQIQTELGRDSYGLFASIQATEFRSLLSNLINNSVEAIEGNGSVTVSLRPEQDQLVLIIADTGNGIPPEVLPKLTASGATFGKQDGSGIGLYHARQCLEEWNGSLTIHSEVNKGTSVECRIPIAPAPSWFVPELSIARNGTVVILDDDSSVHQIWKGRFESSKASEHGVTLLHFSTTQEVVRWHNERMGNLSGAGETLYLFDFELLGDSRTGLELIEQLGIENESILVTSRYEERGMREEAQRLRVRLIPKGLVGFVPITYRDGLELLDAVLIDDDNLVHRAWHSSARTHERKIRTFGTVDAFFGMAAAIDKRTPIYIDSKLGDDVVGEVIAKTVFDSGFKVIFLATGFDASDFDHASMPWIKEIVGKIPPWEQPV